MTQPHLPPAGYQPRRYRQIVHSPLKRFDVVVKETDLLIHADCFLQGPARQQILKLRGQLESFMQRYPAFTNTLIPWPVMAAPEIVRQMIHAGRLANTGPMAAVAGALAAGVGQTLLQHSQNVIVENGGDIFLRVQRPVTIGIYAGNSPLSLKLGLRCEAARHPLGVCTSSGTVGHSLSYGKADAVCVMSPDCALADAVATALGNRLQTARDIGAAIDFGRHISGVAGLLIIMGADLGAWGQVEVVPL